MSRRKKKIKASDLFAYESTVTMSGKEFPCKWNFNTFIRAERFVKILEEDLSATELIELARKADMTSLLALLYGAVKEGNPKLSDLVYSQNYRHEEMSLYLKCVIDGIINFLPEAENQEEQDVYLNPRFLIPFDDETDDEDFNLFTSYYALARKHLNMTDSEIKESTARGIKIKLEAIAELVKQNEDDSE